MTPFTHGGDQYRQAPGPNGAIDKLVNGAWVEVAADDPIYAVRAAATPATAATAPAAAAPSPAAAAPSTAPATIVEPTQDEITALIAQYPAYKGYIPGLPAPVLTPPSPGKPPAYPGDPTAIPPSPGGADTGARTITLSNPNGRPGATAGVTLTIGRSTDGTSWTVTKDPQDTKEPTPSTAGPPVTQAERDSTAATAASTATKAASDTTTDVAKNQAEDVQRQYNWVQHGLWMTHAEYEKYSEDKDANSRANAKVQADASQAVWARNNADKQLNLEAKKADLDAHKPITQKDANGNEITLLYDPETKQYSTPAGVTGAPPQARWLVGDNTTSPRRLVLDGQGHVMSDDPNTAFVPSTTALTSDTVAPFIHTLQQQPDGSYKLVSVPNDNQLTVTQAMMEVLYPQLAKAMTDKTMNAQTAKDLMTAASNKAKDEVAAKNADISAANGGTTAANDTLTQLNQGATTGAGILKDRVDQTQESLRSWISAAGANKNLGLGTQLGADFGANLVGGLGDWATQMGGGQGVYDNATAAVAAINPDDPHSAPSYATLSQMQQRFKDLAGVPHPTEAASAQTGLATPQPQATPTLTPTMTGGWQRADSAATAQVNPATGLAAPGMAGTVAPGSPNYLGLATPQPPLPPGMTQMPGSNTAGLVRGPLFG